MSAPSPSLGTLLVLGRISNLPTVWSNCLAAWLLSGGGPWFNFLVLCSGATLLYVGGMFLNDAFDADFDREFRRDRPIPAGKIAECDVWWIGGELVLFGWLLLFLLGSVAGWLGLGLVLAIVVYDAIHKRTKVAPVLMALCRLLLYLVAGAAAFVPVSEAVVWHGMGLAIYVTGLSVMARKESGQGSISSLSGWLLLAPLVVNCLVHSSRNLLSWVAFAGLALWLIRTIRPPRLVERPNIGRIVSGLLAGIVLVDVSALPQLSLGIALTFFALFQLALLLQRKIPAT